MILSEGMEPFALSLVLTSDADTAAAARHRVRMFLDVRGIGSERSTNVELLLSEMVVHAVEQSDRDVEVYVRVDHRSARIWVSDLAPRAPNRAGTPVDHDDEWGLRLIHTLASKWGVRSRVDGRPGTTVWAELALS